MVTFDTMSRGSLCSTRGLSVQVEPRYLPQNSDPSRSNYVFAYHITIRNDSIRTATLRKRRWIIIDADGDRNIVEGDGVVGQQPTLEPGDSYEYTSFCPLETRWGTMEGAFLMEDSDGGRFEIAVGRFFFVGPVPDESQADSSAPRR